MEWARLAGDGEAIASHGYRPDYSGPYLSLFAEMVKLARQDLSDSDFQADARAFLECDLVALFAECLGIDERLFLSE